jgi:hypothetical protein
LLLLLLHLHDFDNAVDVQVFVAVHSCIRILNRK